MNDSDLGQLIRSTATRHDAPPHLHRRIARALRGGEPDGSMAKLRRTRPPWLEWIRLGCAFASGLVLALGLTWLLPPRTDAPSLVDEVVADHVRSTLVDHLTDVASTDQHTVKPWFNGRLTYSPPVHDLQPVGFPLIGGRLDYLDGRPVAVLVYRRRLHPINVFVMPCSGPELSTTMQSRQGFNVMGWCDSRMRYWVVSDLNSIELDSFIKLLRQTDSDARYG